MPKIAFIGAGSTIFVKNVVGDCMLRPELKGSTVALYDIDGKRLNDSLVMLENLNKNFNARFTIKPYLGVEKRREALRGARYVVNAIQVGGYKPSTVIDFKIPKKYGLRQTIGDTLGIGGIFRALRTIPVVLDCARDMEKVCPDAWFLNYVNPMAMITGALLRGSGIKAVGLCHSVQGCAGGLLNGLGIEAENVRWKIAGINHQAWLVEITENGKDLYPLIKEKAREKVRQKDFYDMVRCEIMFRFGYYVTESSEHSSEYLPYFIKKAYPELIERFNIPLDEYPRRCIQQIKQWNRQREEIAQNKDITHTLTEEYASSMIEAMETGRIVRVHGNVLNNGLITNLPKNAVVETACLVDRNGVTPCFFGDLPEQCAALNRTNINVQLLTLQAAMTGRKEYVYQAAMLDPHTSSELSLEEIVALCDDLFEAHGDMIPRMSGPGFTPPHRRN